MMNVVAKTGQLSTYLKASSQVVASGLKPLAAGVPGKTKQTVQPEPERLTSYTLSKISPTGNIRISSGPAGK